MADISDVLFLGELSLDGELRHLQGVLPMVGLARDRGVLFLDELPEFGHTVLEVMRQPLEDGVVSLGRARGTITLPARFTLVGAMNPCPCGHYGDQTRACSCLEGTVSRYRKRLSGPLLDRIDLHAEVPRVDYDKLSSDGLAESSAAMRARVEAARAQ